jgi:hypothetical protein
VEDLPTFSSRFAGRFGGRLLWGGKSFSLEVPGLVGGTLYPQSVSCVGVNQGFDNLRGLILPPMNQYAFLLTSYPIGSMR